MSEESSPKELFAELYQGAAPWDIGKPQTSFANHADEVEGDILDCGCGTGENALFFAARGHSVTGVDFLSWPLEIARRKARERGLSVDFLEMDALAIGTLPRLFHSVIDCGLLHGLSDEDRVKYVAALGEVLQPGGKVFLMCFSPEEPPGNGPRRVSQEELRAAFSDGWEIESIEPTRFDVRTDIDMDFTPGGPHAWFVIARRV